jgi:hypothetical protein
LSCPWERKIFFVSCWPFVVYRRRDDHFRSKGHSLDVRLYCFKLYTQNPFVVLCSYVILYAHISAAIPKWFPTRSHRHRGEKIKQKAKKGEWTISFQLVSHFVFSHPVFHYN